MTGPDRSHLELAVPEPDPLPPKPRRTGCSVFGWLALVLALIAAGCTQWALESTGAPAALIAQSVEHRPVAARSLGSEVAGSSPAHWAGVPPPPDTGTAPRGPVTGIASWYAARGNVASVPWFRWGDEPVWAVVCRFADGLSRCVTVLVVGFCQCLVGTDRERVIDLSDGAFRQLAPLSVGLIRVTVELTGNGPGLPATDSRP